MQLVFANLVFPITIDRASPLFDPDVNPILAQILVQILAQLFITAPRAQGVRHTD